MTEPPDGFIAAVHERLAAHYDIDAWHWNVATPAFAVCLGAILVQHTNWSNVERALVKLQAAGVDSAEAVVAMAEEELAELVRPSGTPRPKARRLQAFAGLALESGGLEALLARPHGELRPMLLATYGIGPETADAILLYAAGYPVIVHDAYTARLFRRLGFGPERDGYAAWQAWLERLPTDLGYRRAHHAAIVLHCKATCQSRPKCATCPLFDMCAYGKSAAQRAGVWAGH